jgi:DNA-binding NarL/FixJ family response regulator
LDSKLKILLVEDHELTRKGIIYGLRKQERFEIAGEASDGKEAVEMFEALLPDIVLMDIALPVLNGIEATSQIKKINPQTKVIMLTSYGEEEKIFSAFKAGADAYCMKDIKLPRLNKIIEVVAEGGIWLDPKIAHLILKVLSYIPANIEDEKTRQKSNTLHANRKIQLTSREKEILTLISRGKNNKDIAEELSVSIYTVKNHVSNIISKLAVEDRTQAAIKALNENLL